MENPKCTKAVGGRGTGGTLQHSPRPPNWKVGAVSPSPRTLHRLSPSGFQLTLPCNVHIVPTPCMPFYGQIENQNVIKMSDSTFQVRKSGYFDPFSKSTVRK